MMKWLKEILGDNHSEDIEKKVEQKLWELYAPRGDYDALEGAKKQLEEDLTARDSQIADLKKKNPDNEALQKEIARLEKENSDQAAARQQDRIDASVELVLTNAKARNHKAVRALLDLEKAELDEDGKTIKGLDKQVKKLMEAEDSKMLFEAEPAAKLIGMKPAESFLGADGKVDIAKMSYEELAEYMESNPDAQI